MKLKGMPECYLCDNCGKLRTVYTIFSETPSVGFCSWNCLQKSKEQTHKHRCWICALKLEGPIAFYWGETIDEGDEVLPIFCSLDCRQRYERETQKGKVQSWISVKDRLPQPKDAEMIYTSQSEHFLIGYDSLFNTTRITEALWFWQARKWFLIQKDGFPGEEITDRILYWQPLPELPLAVAKDKIEIGKCLSCRYWYYDDRVAGTPCRWGLCAAPNDALWVEVKGTYGFTSIGQRRTASYWGCIQFEPRKET